MGGKGVLAVKHQMDAAVLQRVSLHLLPGARHIVLCEERSSATWQALSIISRWLTGGSGDLSWQGILTSEKPLFRQTAMS